MQVNNNYTFNYSHKRKREFVAQFENPDMGAAGPELKKVLIEEEITEGDSSSNDGCSEESTTTKVVNLLEFRALLHSMRELSFSNRMSTLRKVMSPKDDHHDLYIEVNGVEQLENPTAGSEDKMFFLKLTLTKDNFKSSSFTESNMKEDSHKKPRQHYHVLRFYEYVEDDKHPDRSGDVRIMKMYSSFNGTKGELAWVQKGYKITGNSLIRLYGLMSETLPIQTTYLYDDANISYVLSRRVTSKISLRKLKVLASPLDTGFSWYEEKWGFAPALLTGFKAAKNTFDQNPESYKEAISRVRNTSLETLQRIYPRRARQIQTFRDRYLSQKPAITSRTPLTLRRKHPVTPRIPTVHNLIRAISEAERISETKKQAQKDLSFIFKYIIQELRVVTNDEEGKIFIADLEQIEGMRIFIKET